MLLIVAVITLVIVYLFGKYVIFRIPPIPILEETYWGKDPDHKDEDISVRPFKISVSNEVLEDLRYRLTHAIIPEPIENAKQHYGFNGNLLKDVINYWLNTYDWKQREAYLNQFPHFKTKIQGLDIHFIHVKPKVDPNTPVYPIMVCHGWASSVREFYDIIPILTKVHEEYGFAFEVVVPSLPGFAFSEATTKPGLGAAQMSLIYRNLMLRLGHEKFFMHGGDWGSSVNKYLAVFYPENVLGLHCTLPIADSNMSWVKYLFGSIYPRFVVDKEHEHLMYPLQLRLYNFIIETGYFHIQATKPDTVGVAVANSPVGLAAYLLEKHSTLANAEFKDRDDGGLLERYTYDKLIDNLMLYWISGCITSSARIYYESNARSYNISNIPIDAKIPCAVAKFPNEVLYQSDYILRDKYVNLVQSTDFNEGGHFPAMENGLAEPFAQDLFSAVNKMRTFRSL